MATRRRPDPRITADVCTRLEAHAAVDARDIDVDVVGGRVVLQGSAGTRRAKRVAGELAAAVTGVHDVENRLAGRRGELRHGHGGAPRAA